jgi:hypothetical protein
MYFAFHQIQESFDNYNIFYYFGKLISGHGSTQGKVPEIFSCFL